MGSTPLGYCWFIYKIGGRTGRLTGQFETYAQRIYLYQHISEEDGQPHFYTLEPHPPGSDWIYNPGTQ